MSNRNIKSENQKQCGFETLEERRVFSAQSLAEVVVETQDFPDAIQAEILAHVETTTALQDVHEQTGASYVEQQYGFDGAGQTVAIIDSGIAFDHADLGSGFGPDSRVVGGYDFAEGDSNPFDDGGAGFHGTHVAGIVGSTDEVNRGVSPGVDLVGLRVFDDAGAGNLEWVEQALQWVIDNKDAFENPITTVNLSLGTSWNAETVPEWATLEDEFQQLEMEGIFISVAAGNSFQEYGTEGLSYPASSPFVVPVASHDANGNISDFSQRAEGVLVAPGENIASTVPDHLFGGTRPDSFLSASGTSQAAPYVAGASAIVRQALQFEGIEDIDQDLIYSIFRDTADQLSDAVTGNTYDRLNLRAAIDSIIGDSHGDNSATATQINGQQLIDGTTIQGTIGKVSDVDAFKFTANQSGRVTLEVETTDDLIANLDLVGISAEVDGNLVSFDVERGQEYEFSLSTSDGIGHYQISATLESAAASVAAVQWGGVEQEIITNIDGNGTYQFSATREGILTVITENQTGSVQLYDAQMNEIPLTSNTNGQLRFDVSATEGEQFFLRATGGGTFDASLTNLVSLEDGQLWVHGTQGSDQINFDARSGFQLEVNSVSYQFDSDEVQQISIDGQDGLDRLRLNLGDTNDVVTMGPGSVVASNNEFQLSATNVEGNVTYAGGGQNSLTLNDSAGNDAFFSDGSTASLIMQGMASRGQGFQFVKAVSSSGNDTATLNGTNGDDRFAYRNGTANLQTSDGQVVLAVDFENTVVDAGGGNDRANIFDSSGDDQFILNPNHAYAQTDFGELSASDFEQVNAIANQGGNDSITMFDSAGDDRFHQSNNVSTIRGDGYLNRSVGFDFTSAVSTDGHDIAQIFGSAGNDFLEANASHTTLTSGGNVYDVSGFQRVNVVAGAGGTDVAILNGTENTDRVYLDANGTSLSTEQGLNRAVGFDEYIVHGNGGLDSATLVGSDGDDRLHSNGTTTTLESAGSQFTINDFQNQRFDGKAGFDVVSLEGFDEDDLLEGDELNLRSAIDETTLSATNFSFLNAATDLVSRYDMSTVDYLFMLDGDWEEVE